MRSDSNTPSREVARPGFWARLRFALWLFWRRLLRR